MDFVTVIYNWTLETAPVTIGKNVSENATIQNDDELLQEVQPNCTELSRLNLMEVFARTDIGNTKLWGSMSEAWLACFIVYYAISSILLVITMSSYAYFLRRGRLLVCTILILFAVRFCFSCVHHVLLVISIVNGSSVQLANATRALEIIASSSFMSFAIVTVLSSDPKSYSSQLQQYIIFFFIPIIYSIAGANIVVSLLAGSSALIALIVIRLSILVVNILFVNLDINYKLTMFYKQRVALLVVDTEFKENINLSILPHLLCLFFLCANHISKQ